jgi:NitT/TauT family transport system substrate-binding protein
MDVVMRALCILGLLWACAASACAESLTKVGVVLNFAADGGAAGFYHALERGYFRELGLDVTIEPSKGSADAITRTASQASEMGVGDISTLVEFASRRPEIAPKAVFILHNRSPQAVISLKARGIAKLTDLYGRILGQGPADAASRMFPALAHKAGLDLTRIELRQFSPQLRDSMLLTKQVDAVTGFDSTVVLNLKANGVAVDEVAIIYYADHGLDVYGMPCWPIPLSWRPIPTRSKLLSAPPRAGGAMPLRIPKPRPNLSASTIISPSSTSRPSDWHGLRATRS